MKIIWNHAYLMMVLTALAWSGNAIVAKGTNEIIPPIGLAFWRWAIALPILLIMAWPHLRQDLLKIKGNWLLLMALSALGIATYNMLLYQGLLSTTAINSFLINTSRPSIIVVLSILLFNQGITLIQSMGFVLASIGTIAIVLRGDLSHLLTLNFNTGDLWILGATFCWAFYTVLMKKRPPMHSASFLAATVFFGTIMILPFYIWETIYVKSVPFSMEMAGSVLYLAAIASVFGHLLYNRAVEIVGPNKAGQVSYILPIVGSGLAIILLGEEFEFYHGIGFPLILMGVYFGSKGK